MEVEVATREPGFAVGYLPGLLVSCWAGRVTRARVVALEGVLPEVLAVSPEATYVAVSVIDGRAPVRIDDDARARSTRLQRRMQDHMQGHAYLVEGRGFVPAAVRTLTAGLHLVTRSRYPLAVFEDPWATATWVAERGSLEADDVLRAITALRTD